MTSDRRFVSGMPLIEAPRAFRETLVPNTGLFDYQLCNVFGGVARPPFGRVEGDDAQRVIELSAEKIIDDGLLVATRSSVSR